MSGEVETLRQQLQQLAQLHVDGALSDEAYRESRATLERRLVDAVMRGDAVSGPSALSARRPARVWAGLTAVAVVAAALGYLGFQAAVPTASPVMSGSAEAGAANPHASDGPPASAGTLSGTVSLSPDLARRAAPDDTVFIFARAAGSAGMPLAVLRKQVKDLPAEFTLDDTLAMVPASRLSNVSRATVTARISKTGDAIPQAGDLSGQSAEVPVGTSGLRIVIDTIVK